MNVIHLSPHFPRHYSLFARRLQKHGVEVLGITDQKDENLTSELRSVLAGHYCVDQMENTEQVFRACRFFQSNFGCLDRVESHLESWIELEAAIREAFGIPGLRPGDLQFMKRKSLMKQVFARAGVPTARGVIVESYEQCRSFINARYPVFIKPDSGVGAGDTFTIRSDNDLRFFFASKNERTYFLEEYLAGIIESFDGLTDREGNLAFFSGHVFSNDIHRIVSNDENLSYYNVRVLPKDIEAMGKQVVKSSGIKEKFFHIEFFRLADGSLRGLEINMRPPGGLTTDMFNFSADIDVYDWWAQLIATGRRDFSFDRKYHCAFVGCKNNRRYSHSHDEIVSHFGSRVLHWQPMNPIEVSVMGNFAYLVRSVDLEEVKEMIRFIQQEAQ